VPFGSADRAQLQRICEQLGQLSTDFAAVKQQVADQQHTIDEIRRDTTAAITTGLADIRAVARDALTRTHETLTGPLATIGNELVAVRGTIAQIDSKLMTQPAGAPPAADTYTPPRPAPEPEPQPAPEPAAQADPRPAAPEPQPAAGAEADDRIEPDPLILRAAAGVAHATIEAHRDTWAFLIQIAGNEQHFHIPGKVEDHDGFVSVRFSGPSLVAAITSLTHVIDTTGNPVTRAIADHIRLKTIASVRAIIDNPGRDGDGTPLRIVIDDRAAPEGIEEDQGAG
jgi:hypothetical protein